MTRAITQSFVLAGRTFNHWRAQPVPFLVNLLFPTLVLLMMGGLLGGAIAGDLPTYFWYAVPGVLAVAMLFGLEGTMLAITTDAKNAITDRLRSLPISGAAVPAGRCLADMAASLLALATTCTAGLLMGWRPGRWTGLVEAALVLLAFRFALLWLGLFAGLRATSPEVVVAVQILVWPISMLSSVFVDPATMPRWLGAVAEWNPLSAAANAVRELTGSPTFTSTTWAGQHAIMLSLVASGVVTAVFAPLAVRAYRNLDA